MNACIIALVALGFAIAPVAVSEPAAGFHVCVTEPCDHPQQDRVCSNPLLSKILGPYWGC